MTQETAQIASLPAEILSKLFKELDIPAPLGALEQACLKTKTEATGPVDQLGRIFQAANRRNARAALVRWDRFDHRHLPAMLWYQDAWWLVEHGETGMIQLSGEHDIRQIVTTDDIGEALVLWVQVVGKKQETRFTVVRSPGVRLLLTEILATKRWLVEVLVATVVVNVLAVTASLFSMQVYDRVVPSFSYATLWALVMGMVIVTAMDWLLKVIRARILDNIAKQVDQRVSQHLFEHLMRLRLDTRPRSLGTMAAQVQGLESVRAFFSASIIFALTDFPFALFFIAVIGVLGGPIGWVYFTLLCIAQLVGFLAQFRLRDLSRQEIQRSHERHGMLVDTIQGTETIQSAGAEWRFAEYWRDITTSIASYSLKSRLLSTLTNTTTATLGTAAYVAAIVVGVMEIEAGHLTMGGLIACTILGGRVLAPVVQSVQTLTQWQHVRESLQMVDSLLVLEQSRPSDKDLLVPDSLTETLQLESIRFAYPGLPVLRLNINMLSVQAGERVVILGTNGSGKSTLLKVAAGLYRPSSGQVRLGGADIRELDQQVMNEWIGHLPQDVHLFKGTLRSNITVAGGISDAKVLEVAGQLGIDRIAADSPRGMEMEISEGGQGLSGGQRQLVALSRIFLAAPRIWLLDEPTASLDDESEIRIIEAFKQRIRPTDMMLITTHRPRLMALANRVIVMRGGQIIADGPPEKILKRLQAPLAVPAVANKEN